MSLNRFPQLVMLVGVLLVIAGIATGFGGVLMNNFVTGELQDQNIVTPGDASIPNAQVDDIPTALSMADIIEHHAASSSGGLTYAQMGRFAVESGDPAGTSNPDEALRDQAGNPVPNGARNTQLTAAGLVTSLSLSAMAIGLSYGTIGFGVLLVLLGLVVTGLGYMMLGLVSPEVAARYGLRPVSD